VPRALFAEPRARGGAHGCCARALRRALRRQHPARCG
jgi:hypothetical protein